MASIRNPSTVTVPAVGLSIPATRFRIVVFPLPDGPTIATNSPAPDHEIDPAQRPIVDPAHPIRLLDPTKRNQGSRLGGELRVRSRNGGKPALDLRGHTASTHDAGSVEAITRTREPVVRETTERAWKAAR
jgi:hypothetical protein